MSYTITQRRLVTRYLLLYCLFGIIVGVQLGAAAWVVKLFNPGENRWGHLIMASLMAGLVLGEVCGARITERYTSSSAVLFAAAAFAISALASLLGVYSWLPYSDASFSSALLLAAAFSCGIGLGTQHSSLDAWFSVSTRITSERSPTDSEMGWGYTTYTLGFFLGQVLFFPMMYHFDWSWKSPIVADGLRPLPISISAAPFILALAAAILVIVFRPYVFHEKGLEPARQKGRESLHSVAGVFRRGGVAFVTMLVVGSCVSFVIFHIDTFASPDLLPGSSVPEKTLGLGILCFVTFAMVGIFSWILEADKRLSTLSPAARTGVLAFNLISTALLLGLIVVDGKHLGWSGVAVVLGISSGFVNTLPQVVKWAILDCAVIEDKARASAILGIAKRIPNLGFSLVVAKYWGLEDVNPNFAYNFLIAAIVIALLALLIYYSRVRSYSLTIVCSSDKAISMDGVLAANISDVPNTILKDSKHVRAANGQARLNLSIYSTSKDYVRELLRGLRRHGSVSRVVIKRTRNLL